MSNTDLLDPSEEIGESENLNGFQEKLDSFIESSTLPEVFKKDLKERVIEARSDYHNLPSGQKISEAQHVASTVLSSLSGRIGLRNPERALTKERANEIGAELIKILKNVYTLEEDLKGINTSELEFLRKTAQ